MPNNKEQVKQRASSLKHVLLKNPQFLCDSKTCIDNLFSKSSPKRVPPERLHKKNGKVRYTPHHGVYHLHKSGKVRVVVDCSCKYKGMSLNDILLAGTDLSNQLFGVPMRFREDPVALMADIESMFYQVRVLDHDIDVLRFLWWTNGNLTKDLNEYQMLVHLFGAVSLPSCSNVCPFKKCRRQWSKRLKRGD